MSQKPYQLHPKDYRLGKIENWKNDTFWFTLRNTSSSEWYILPQFYNQEYQVLHTRDRIQSGQSTRVGVLYYTEYTGGFNVEIPLYINVSNDKIMLKISGNIRTIDPNALVYCPPIRRSSSPVASAEPKERVQIFNVGEKEEENEPEKVEEKVGEEYAFEDDFLEDEEEDIDESVPVISIPEVVEEEVKVVDSPDEFRSDAIPNNIVLVLDRSRSMSQEDKIEKLKLSLNKLIRALRPQDKITLISYSRSIEVHCEGWSGERKDEMIKMVENLNAEGGSYGSKGMEMAYKMVAKYRIPEGNNAIVLATDGKFNDKDFSEEKLQKKAKSMNLRYQISLSGLGYGTDPRALQFLESLADAGNGRFINVEEEKDNERMILNLVKDLSGSI